MKPRLGTLLLLPILLLSTARAEEMKNIFTEELPPFNFTEKGEVRGISTDLLLAASEKAGLGVERASIRSMPWSRSYEAALAAEGSILYSTARTEPRLPLFQWAGPIDRLTIGLIAKKERGVVIASPGDFARYRIGTVRDGAPEELLIAAGADPGRLERIGDARQNIKKLAADRIDAFPFLVPTARYLLAKEGFDPNDYEIVLQLKSLDLFFALGLDVPAESVRALQAALDELKRPGPEGKSAYDAIVRRYLAF